MKHRYKRYRLGGKPYPHIDGFYYCDIWVSPMIPPSGPFIYDVIVNGKSHLCESKGEAENFIDKHDKDIR